MNDHQVSRNRGISFTVIGLLVVITLIVGGFVRQFVGPKQLDPNWLEAHGTYLFELPREFDPVVFTDKDRQTFTGDDFDGAWTLVFFGFTYCPDICPTTLAQLSQVFKQLKPASEALTAPRVVLVTVDPARDTPEHLKPYIEHFNPTFNALTGEFMDIHRFATQLNTPFRKVIDPDDPAQYTVDHSGNIALLNPYGDYAGFIKAPFDNDRLLRVIEAIRTLPH
jgi:protein SCO1/2